MFGAAFSFEAKGRQTTRRRKPGVPLLQGAASSGLGSRAVDFASLRHWQDKYVKNCYVSSTLVATSEGRMDQ
jgi:hypothetical protein